MRYIRAYLPAALVAEEGEDGAVVVVVIDTEAPTPGNAAIARCVDGVVAQAIADALNAV